MNAAFQLGISFLAIDNFSNKFGNIQAKLGKFEKYANSITDKMRVLVTPMNTALFMGATAVMKNFAETEDATIQLRNTMMGIGGVVSKEFESVSKKAEELGAKLPGTTADFYKMASSMRALGVGDSSLSSALEATAQMAVVLKPIGVSFEQASEATAKFKNALGIADADMVAFADTVQRTAHMGVSLTEMQYAFARSAGMLKVMNLQGLESANALSPVVAMLIKTGMSGETAGTAISKIFSIGMQKKQFKDVEGMFKWLEKLDPKKIHKIFGGGMDETAAQVLWKSGKKGYADFVKEMENQGSLGDRLKPSLGSLTNTWEAMSGAMNKASVAFGGLFAANVKSAANFIGSLSDKLSGLIEKFPNLSKAIGGVALAISSISLLKGIGGVFGAIFTPGIVVVRNFAAAFSILNSVQAVNKGLWAVEVIKEYGIVGRIAVLTNKAMAASQALLNAVMNLNPYVLAVTGVIALTGAMAGLVHMMNKATTSTEIYNDVRQSASERTMDEKAELKLLFDQLRVTTEGTKERADIIQQLKQQYPDYLSGIDLEKSKNEELVNTYNQVAEAMQKKAEQEVIYERKKELIKKQFESKLDEQTELDNRLGRNGTSSSVGQFFKDMVFQVTDREFERRGYQKQIDMLDKISQSEERIKQKSNNNSSTTVSQVVNINGNVDEKNIGAITQKMQASTQQVFDDRGMYNAENY